MTCLVPTVRRLIAAAALSVSFAATASAQAKAEDWTVDHSQAFGSWESICDHGTSGGVEHKRCYIRYLDSYAAEPQSGAASVVIAPEEDRKSLRFEFTFEPGTVFARRGFRIEAGEQVLWRYDTDRCSGGMTCLMAAADAEDILAMLEKPNVEGEKVEGAMLALDFTDSHGRKWERRWDVAPFAPALEDFRAAAKERGLLE